MPGLDPHLARRAVRRVAPGAPRRLHQEREQAFRRAKVAAEERRVGIDRGDEADAAKVVALGDHLRADQDVDLARVDGAERRLERAFPARAVGVDARDPRFGKQRRELLLEALGAATDRRDVGVAALRAAARHRFGEAAVVAAQRPVLLVEDAPGAAMRAAAQPAAVAALEHRRVAAPIQEDEALHAAADALAQGREDLRRERRAPALPRRARPSALPAVAMSTSRTVGQRGAADPLGERETRVAAARRRGAHAVAASLGPAGMLRSPPAAPGRPPRPTGSPATRPAPATQRWPVCCRAWWRS